MQKIKSLFVKEYKEYINRVGSSLARTELLTSKTGQPQSQRYKIENCIKSGKVWQSRFYDHVVRNGLDFEEKLNYIHYNPVKHGLVDDSKGYPYSSNNYWHLDNNCILKIESFIKFRFPDI